jgi:hypothetical protein
MRITTSALIGIAVVGLLAGCGPLSSSSSTAAAGGSTPAASTSGSGSSGGGTAAGCPQASTVSADLGISGLTTQTSKAATSQGHTGYACAYAAGTSIVQVTLVNGISSSFMSTAAQQAASVAGALKTVPGFADQAYRERADRAQGLGGGRGCLWRHPLPGGSAGAVDLHPGRGLTGSGSR